MVPGLGWFSQPTSWSPQLLLSCARCAGPACLAAAPQWVTMRTWHKHTRRCMSRHLCVADPTPAQVPTRAPTPLLTSAAPGTLNLPKQGPPERVECVFLVCEQSFGHGFFTSSWKSEPEQKLGPGRERVGRAGFQPPAAAVASASGRGKSPWLWGVREGEVRALSICPSRVMRP